MTTWVLPFRSLKQKSRHHILQAHNAGSWFPNRLIKEVLLHQKLLSNSCRNLLLDENHQPINAQPCPWKRRVRAGFVT